jgi:hypothetical protein
MMQIPSRIIGRKPPFARDEYHAMDFNAASDRFSAVNSLHPLAGIGRLPPDKVSTPESTPTRHS